MNKKILSLQISEKLYDLIASDADKNYMSISAFVRKLLIQKYEEQLNESEPSGV